jgi:butyryl-CoA dehydrogenase
LASRFPESLGGAGLDAVSYAIIIEEVSRVSGAIGLCVTVHNSVAVYPILAFGSSGTDPALGPPPGPGGKNRCLSASLNPTPAPMPARIEATALAEGDEYRVNANKVFVTNGGIADVCLIFCRTDPDSRTPGHKRGGRAERGTATVSWWGTLKICAVCGPTRSVPSG